MGPQRQKVEQALGPHCEVHATAIVKLYTSTAGHWEWTHLTGAAAFVTNKSENTKAIHVIDLNNNTIPFSQELYDQFAYEATRDFFHTFEMDDCVAGFSFADVQEAKAFQASVTAAGAKSTPPLPAVPNRPPALTNRSALPPTPPKPTPPSPVQPIPAPYVETHHEPAYPPPPAAQPVYAQQQAAPSPVPAKPKEAPQKKPKQGLFGRLKSALTGNDIPEDFAISDPRGFRHESHIGWDPEAGFEIRNIPPEWRKLFQAAGVKKSELRDAETAKFVMNVIGDTILQNGGSLPDMSSAPPPPPSAPAPPPMGSNAPPPPPAPKAPAAPPPPGPYSPPAPRPPAEKPQPPAPVNNARNDLLSSIQKGTALRKVEPRDPSSLPDLSTLNAGQSNNLVSTLAAAMAARRPAVQEDDEELDEEDEWSD